MSHFSAIITSDAHCIHFLGVTARRCRLGMIMFMIMRLTTRCVCSHAVAMLSVTMRGRALEPMCSVGPAIVAWGMSRPLPYEPNCSYWSRALLRVRRRRTLRVRHIVLTRMVMIFDSLEITLHGLHFVKQYVHRRMFGRYTS